MRQGRSREPISGIDHVGRVWGPHPGGHRRAGRPVAPGPPRWLAVTILTVVGTAPRTWLHSPRSTGGSAWASPVRRRPVRPCAAVASRAGPTDELWLAPFAA
jgi:hypothetical protein